MIHDLKQEQMTPEERNQLAIDWIQENAPDYVLQQYIGLKNQCDALRTERQQIAAALGIKAETYDLLDIVQATVGGLDDRNEALEIVIAERDALRTAYQTSAAIMRSQPVGIAPRLVREWREVVERVGAVTK